jgi:hypothetical protein
MMLFIGGLTWLKLSQRHPEAAVNNGKPAAAVALG